jgi:hypothetical protein
MAEARCYKTTDILTKLQLNKRTFSRLKREGKLPFLEELKPRLGRHPRYRADLVDRYLAGQWDVEASRFFAHGARRRT